MYECMNGFPVENVFQKSPVGKLLSKLVPKSHRKEMVESYLQDFTKMTYKEQVNGESWVSQVCFASHVFTVLLGNKMETPCLQTVNCIHHTYILYILCFMRSFSIAWFMGVVDTILGQPKNIGIKILKKRKFF